MTSWGEVGERTVETLGRRMPILERLLDGPMDKRTIGDELGISRSTIDRGIRDLELGGFVRYADGVYEPTLSGRIVLEDYETFRSSLASVLQTQQLLNDLPVAAPVDSRLLIGAQQIVGDKPLPGRPDQEVLEQLERAESVWGISGSVQPRFVELFFRNIADGMYNEMVFEPGVVEHLRTAYPEAFDSLLESGNLVVYVIDEDLTFSLKLVDGPGGVTVVFAIYDTSYKVKAILVNRSDAAVEWGWEVYGEYKERASPLLSEPVR